MTKPVFIIGCPRSGTTITLDLLSVHGEFAWVSQVLNDQPKNPDLAAFNKIYDDPVRGRSLLLERQRGMTLPRPVEPWKFWNTYLSKFEWERGGPIPPRRQTGNDITVEEIKTIRSVISGVCQRQGKVRFLSKYTDFPRIRYITQAFPDAIFIHIVRDGRAVANSYYDRIKRGVFGTWEEREWWIRGLPKTWRKEWTEKYQTPLGLAAYLWKFFLNEIWEDAKCVPASQFLEIRYKDLIQSPKTVLKTIFEKCGLGMSSQIEWYLDHVPLTNMNGKWREVLDAQQKEVLEKIITEDRFKKLLDD